MNDTKKDAFLYIARMRRSLRLLARRRTALHDERRALERKVRLLKERGNPFDVSRIKTMEAESRDLSGRAHAVSDNIHEFGKLLAAAAPLIDACTTLNERCEVLNVNVADREGLEESTGIVHIIFAHGLEDSAERRHAEWNDGPLFDAMQFVFLDFLCDTPNGRALGASLFKPGGMFEGVPTYTRQPGGSMLRNPPSLRIASDTGGADDA